MVSILRAGPKKPRYFGSKNPAHANPTGHVGPQISDRARADPGLAWAVHVFCSVK
jgi:hypothetical protein